jgi:hypothetical protein
VIRVTIELIPWGDETQTRLMHTLEIANLTVPAEEESRYLVRLDGTLLTTMLTHQRSKGIWPLVRKACTVCQRTAGRKSRKRGSMRVVGTEQPSKGPACTGAASSRPGS